MSKAKSPSGRAHLRAVPDPTEVLEGVAAARVLDRPAAADLAGTLEAPRHLTEVEASIWREMAIVYAADIKESDRELFALLVDATVTYRDAKKRVRDVGLLVNTKAGNPIQNPYYALMRDARESSLYILQQLGLTPLSRGRLKANRNKKLRTNSAFNDLKQL